MTRYSTKEEEIKVKLDGVEEPIVWPTEWWEAFANNDPILTGYPAPLKHYELAVEKPNQNIEETYYWYFHQIRSDWSYEIEKVVDTYAASQASSHFGHMQSRISVQQNQISQYLKGISDMIKGLYQIVREIRILDERLGFYNGSMEYYKKRQSKNPNYCGGLDSKSPNADEVVLKGLWVDQVEGGAKNPGSVYGLAANVGFTILPDLFFRVNVMDHKSINKVVDKLAFNEKVIEVLKRKLMQYLRWKEQTKNELENRRKFMIKYLRQHYDTIRLYISWVKPYLRYQKQMQQATKLENDPEMISSFESTIVEIEFMAKRKITGNYYSVAVINLLHRVRPELNYHAQEYQHKGPTHTGKTWINIRTYAWTQKEIDAYKKHKNDEDFNLIGSVDQSVQGAMDALGDELERYLNDNGELTRKPEEKEKKEIKQPGLFEPFTAIFKGFAEIGEIFVPPKKSGPSKSDKLKKFGLKKEEKQAEAEAKNIAWFCYKNYKKGHNMMTPW